METKTLAIAVIALLVGAGIGWLAFTTFYADDLATAASVKEAIGEDAYLARGMANQAVKCMETYRDPTSRVLRVRRSTCPTPTPTPSPEVPIAPCGTTPATQTAPYGGNLCVADTVSTSAYVVKLTAVSGTDAQFQILRASDNSLVETRRLPVGSSDSFIVESTQRLILALNRVDSWRGGVLTANVNLNYSAVSTPTPVGPTPSPDPYTFCEITTMFPGFQLLRISNTSEVTITNPLRISSMRGLEFLADGTPVTSVSYAFNETDETLNGYWYYSTSTGYYTKATTFTTAEGTAITVSYSNSPITLPTTPSNSTELSWSLQVQTTETNGFLFNLLGDTAPSQTGNQFYINPASHFWSPDYYYLKPDGYFGNAIAVYWQPWC